MAQQAEQASQRELVMSVLMTPDMANFPAMSMVECC